MPKNEPAPLAAPLGTLHERIRLRAYFLHEVRLREGHVGDSLDDWLRAESELLAIGKPHATEAAAERIEPKPMSGPKRAPAGAVRR